MSRMFHRALATSVIGAAALAAPVTAMAADTGGAGAEPVPTAVVVHLPKHVEAGEPVTVTARVTARTDAEPGGERSGKGQDRPSQGNDQQGEEGGSGKRQGTGGGHHRHKGAGHGKKKAKHHKGRRHTLTGKVSFLLDGKPEPAVAVDRGRASEKIEIPLGRHTIVAEYSGDADYLAAKSDPVTFELTAGQDEPGTTTSTGTSAGTSPTTGTSTGTSTAAQGGTSAQNGDDQNADDCGPGAEAGQDPDHPDYPTLGQDQQDPTFDQGQHDQGPDPDQGQDDRRQDD